MVPLILSPPTNLTVLLNSNAAFSVIATGSPPLTYQWQLNNRKIGDATNSTLIGTNAQATNAGTYIVTVANTVGSVSTQAVLTVLGAPIIVTPPTNQTVSVGANPTFAVTVSGATNSDYAATLSYQWRFAGSDIANATTSAYTISNVQFTNAGNYAVVISNSFGTNSATATLTVQGAPQILLQPTNRLVMAGGSTTFTVPTAGSQPMTFTWKHDGSPVFSAQNYTINGITLSDAGNYVVVVSNVFGVAQSFPAAQLKVLSAAPTLIPVGFVSNHFRVAYQAESNITYILQYATNVPASGWIPLTTNPGVGSSVIYEDPATPAPARFYRLLVQ
jgi:hypothetical protein